MLFSLYLLQCQEIRSEINDMPATTLYTVMGRRVKACFKVVAFFKHYSPTIHIQLTESGVMKPWPLDLQKYLTAPVSMSS